MIEALIFVAGKGKVCLATIIPCPKRSHDARWRNTKIGKFAIVALERRCTEMLTGSLFYGWLPLWDPSLHDVWSMSRSRGIIFG